MAEFLTTRGISYHLEEIIKKAETHLFIVTPYIKLSQNVYDRLHEKSLQGVIINIVYGKVELDGLELKRLQTLKCNLFFSENLHAKCYANEHSALIGSMNLHSYSEITNKEIGVKITNLKDRDAFNDCIIELKSIINTAVKKSSFKQVNKPISVLPKYDYRMEWHKYLKQIYGDQLLEGKFEDRIFYYKNDFPIKNFDFTTKHGSIVGFIVHGEKQNLKETRELRKASLFDALKDYRVYYSAYDLITLYHAKNIEFGSLQEELEYCHKGLLLLIEELKKTKWDYKLPTFNITQKF